MTDGRRSGGTTPRVGVPTVAVGLAVVVALALVVVGRVVRVAAAIHHGPAGPALLPAAPTVDGVVGAVYLLVTVGVVGHLVRERSPHLPDPGDRLF